MASPARPSQENPSSLSPDSREDPDKHPKSGLLKTPHDSAIAGVTGRLTDLGGRLQALSGFGSNAKSTNNQGLDPQVSVGDADYDPWDGQVKGRLVPVSDVPGEGSRSAQMWAHLATVRRLQAELSAAHIAMEHVGESRAGGQGSGGDRPPSNIPEDDTAEMDAKFKGQQASIEVIMSKLDDLSKAVTAYHNVPTPQPDLFLSRSNTLSSNDIVGPDLSDPGSSPRPSLEQTAAAASRSIPQSNIGPPNGPPNPIAIPGRILEDQHHVVQSPVLGI